MKVEERDSFNLLNLKNKIIQLPALIFKPDWAKSPDLIDRDFLAKGAVKKYSMELSLTEMFF